MDESDNQGCGSGATAHRDPGRAGQKNLPRLVRARDWPMSLPNYPVERTGAHMRSLAAAHRGVRHLEQNRSGSSLGGIVK
jgi:hypothetical protein